MQNLYQDPDSPPLVHGGFTPGSDNETIMPVPRGPTMPIQGGGLLGRFGGMQGFRQRFDPSMRFGGGGFGGMFPGMGGGFPWMGGGSPGMGGRFPGMGGGFPGGGGFYGGSFMPAPFQQNMFMPGMAPPWMRMGMNTNFSPSANMFQNQMMRSQVQTPGGFFGFQPPPVTMFGPPAAPPQSGGGNWQVRGGDGTGTGATPDDPWRPSEA